MCRDAPTVARLTNHFCFCAVNLIATSSTVDAAAIDAALAKIISPRDKYAAPAVSRGWRERLAAFGFGGTFTPRFAAAAALVVLAVTIGIVALLLQRQDPEISPRFRRRTPITPARR